MTSVAVQRERQPRHLVPAEPASLDALAATANEHHRDATSAARTAIEHAIAGGAALLEAKALVEPGKWMAWVESNFNGTISTANKWMRIARNQAALPSEIGVRRAEIFLSGVVPADGYVWRNDVGTVAEAKRLRAAGKTYPEIAAELSVAVGTAWKYVNSEAKIKRRAAERDALACQEREAEISAAVRKAGAALSEAYSMSARMRDVLAQAEREAVGRAAHVALIEAQRLHHRTCDEIVRALGVS